MTGRRMQWARVIGVLVVSGFAAACGGDADPSGDADLPMWLDVGVDAGSDAGQDAGQETAGQDAAAETTEEAVGPELPAPDAAQETGPDAAVDAVDDTAPDAEADAFFDPGPPPCDLGTEKCFGVAGDGRKCGQAIGIGRIQAGVLQNHMANPKTWDEDDFDNNDDLDQGCRDAGNDLFYRIYLLPGEQVNVQMVQADTIEMVLKAYRGTSCAGDEPSLITCQDETSSCKFKEEPARCGNLLFTADIEGWYTIVLDGKTSDDQGQHLIQIYLMGCTDANCCCPY